MLDGGQDADDSDERLASACDTDPTAFGALYDRYVDRVYRYCARRLPTVEAAEDATSQTFMEALRSIGRYRADRATFRTWLFAIAHHVVVDQLRAHRPTSPLDADQPAGDADDHRSEVDELLTRLPDDQRQVIELRLVGLTHKEIGAVLGKRHGAVRVAHHRAMERLKTIVRQEAETT